MCFQQGTGMRAKVELIVACMALAQGTAACSAIRGRPVVSAHATTAPLAPIDLRIESARDLLGTDLAQPRF